MGKSAKLYKKKPKTKRTSSIQNRNKLYSDDEEDQLVAQLAQKKEIAKAKHERNEKNRESTKVQESTTNMISKPSKLKSKLWKQLDAKRAQQGLPELSTPKEAGIDYLSQWERKSRR